MFVNPTVPTGTPIDIDYTGSCPQVHSMNDPSGVFCDDAGTWHLY
jgi:beta-fructofuranosidase